MQTPRQLARMASMHRLPSREASFDGGKRPTKRLEEESSPNKIGSHRGFHQSFFRKKSTGGGGVSGGLGSRGSSFSFGRTDTFDSAGADSNRRVKVCESVANY